MTIAEVVIRHVLWGIPGATHVTPDGQKLYFLVGNELKCIEATDKPFGSLSVNDINHMVESYQPTS